MGLHIPDSRTRGRKPRCTQIRPNRGSDKPWFKEDIFIGLVKKSFLLVGILLGFAAQSAPGVESDAAGHTEHSAGHVHANHVAVFLGVTTGGEDENQGKEDAALTIGLDYERRLTDLIGIGILGDWAFGDRREFIIGIPVFLHFGQSAKFLIAPGLEKTRGNDDRERRSEFLMRLGLAYDFHFENNTVSPTFNVDFLDGEQIYVLGVNVGWGF